MTGSGRRSLECGAVPSVVRPPRGQHGLQQWPMGVNEEMTASL